MDAGCLGVLYFMNNLNKTKVCCRCQIEQTTSEFYKHKNKKDGFEPYCKTCEKRRKQGLKTKPKIEAQLKTCYRCKIEKGIEHFCKNKLKSDGFDTYCKTCSREHLKAYRDKPKTAPKDKVCDTCSISKYIECFHRRSSSKDGFHSTCKICRQPETKKYNRENKEKISLGNKRIRLNRTESQKQALKDKAKEWRIKRKLDDLATLKINIRSLILINFKNSKTSKQGMKSEEILGCTFEEFRDHIEKQFLDWMSWENRATYTGGENEGWDLDHIIPSSAARTREEVIRLNHYTNFQPLCSHINRIRKRNLIPNICNTFFKDESNLFLKNKDEVLEVGRERSIFEEN